MERPEKKPGTDVQGWQHQSEVRVLNDAAGTAT
jgi:hypothetical protein